MNKYKKIVSIAATAVMCVAPMSVYAQEAQTDVIEAVAEKKQDTESSSVPGGKGYGKRSIDRRKT